LRLCNQQWGGVLGFVVADFNPTCARAGRGRPAGHDRVFYACLWGFSAKQSLLASVGNEPVASQFIELKIPPAPMKQDETWSEWILATERADLSSIPEPEWFAARHRVPPG
jgi:hypothetical protein